jgi:menaquinone-dependent protoporphyrinogen oxidase
MDIASFLSRGWLHDPVDRVTPSILPAYTRRRGRGWLHRDRRAGAGMGKVLVVYGTATGCTWEVAERIGKVIFDKRISGDVVPAADAPSPDGYDAVIVGSGVRAGNWHQPVKDWVATNATMLKEMPVAFFTVCLTMAQEPSKAAEVRAYTDALIAETGVRPVDIGLFAGINEPKRFPFIQRTILKMMKAPEGDFREWDKIEAWTGEIVAELGLQPTEL